MLGILGSISFIFPNLIFTYFQLDLNPFSKKPIASPKSNLKLYRLIVKLVLPIYVVLDYKGQYSRYFEIMMTSTYLILLCLRFQAPSFYNHNIDSWMVSSDLLLFWAAMCSSIHAFFDGGRVDNTGLIFVFFGFPLIRYSVLAALSQMKNNKPRFSIMNFRKDYDALHYLTDLIDFIENLDIPEKKTILDLLLKQHKDRCDAIRGKCPC